MLTALLVTCALVLPQDAEPVQPSPFDRVVELEIAADDPVLIEGRGPAVVVEHEVGFEGTLHVWTSSELDLFLRVEDQDGELLGEDDDSGGGTTPYLGLEVEPGDVPSISVAISGGGASGEASLYLMAAPETEATRAAAERGREALAEVMQEAGDPEVRREHLEAALSELLETEGARWSREIATVSWRFGLVCNRLGELQSAHRAQLATRAYHERSLPPDHSSLLRALRNLAVTKYEMGDLAGARELEESALEASERSLPPDHPDLLIARKNLAITLMKLGDLARARELEESVLEARERSLPPDHPDLISARLSFAVTIRAMGDVAGARPLFESVLEARERTLPPDDPDLLRARQNLAVTMGQQGDLPGARMLLESVIEVGERSLPSDHSLLLYARGNLALAMKGMGDLAGARALEESVLEARERSLPTGHPDILPPRLNLAGTMHATGDLAGARTLFESALEGFEHRLPQAHPYIVAARCGLASTLAHSGDYSGARAIFESVLEGLEGTLPPDAVDLLGTRENLAVTLAWLDDLAGARQIEEVVLAGCERSLPPDHSSLLRARQYLATWRLELGDFAGGNAQLSKVVSAMMQRTSSAWLLSPREAREVIGDDVRRLNLVLCPSRAGDSGWRARVFELIETRRAVGTGARRASTAIAADEELRALAAEASRARGALNDLVVGGAREGVSGGAFRQELDALVARRDRHERRIRAALAERAVIPGPVSCESLRSACPEGSAAVGFLRYSHWQQDPETNRIRVGGDHLLAHVLDAQGGLVRLDLGPTSELEVLVRAWRTALGKPIERGVPAEDSGSDRERSAGAELRRRLLDPVLAAAGAETTTLFVCPDDLVYLVPLDALPAGSPSEPGEERVGDRFLISIQSSFAPLVAPQPVREGKPSLLAMGGADFDGEGDAGARITAISAPVGSRERGTGIPERFAPLLQTLIEAGAVATLFGQAFDVEALVLEGTAATKAALVENASGARYLHLATHGWFAPESVKSILDEPEGDTERLWTPMSAQERTTGLAPSTLCGLALAGANRGMNSIGRVPGILTAEELVTLDLSSCELAVLSACETNVGIRRAGQGIQSLQTALHAAGARTAITSLWKVDDAATRKLMELFYTYLWVEKMGKAEALWKAKCDLREAGHPVRDWAGWVLSGDPN